MVKYVLLHYAMGDNIVAFRHITNLVRRHPDDEIKLIFNKQTKEFMDYWKWPSNITLCPLTALLHDVDNLTAFPYQNIGIGFNEEWQGVADGFAEYDGVRYIDYRPAKVKMLPPQKDVFVWASYIPEPTMSVELDCSSLGKYIVVQPMSTSHTLRFEEEELKVYENWLKNDMHNYLEKAGISYVLVGTEKDASMIPNIASLPSTNIRTNLIGKTSIKEFCDIIQCSSGVWGISSAAINIGDYLLGKPVLSWNLRDISIELFDSFLHHSKSLAINRPWLKDEEFYLKYINNFKVLMSS
jgi:hypothetical protein